MAGAWEIQTVEPEQAWRARSSAPPPDEWEVVSTAPIRRRSLGERFGENLEDAVQRSGLGQMARNIDNGDGRFGLDDIIDVRVREGSVADKALSAVGLDVGTSELTPSEKRERQRRIDAAATGAADPFTEAPGGVVGKAAAGAATLAGQLGGAAVSPENWVAPGKTIVQRAAGNAGVAAGTDVLLQGGDVATGVQDEWEPLQTVAAAAVGSGLSVAGDAAVGGARAGARRAADALVPDEMLDVVANPADIPAGRRTAGPRPATVGDDWEVVDEQPATRPANDDAAAPEVPARQVSEADARFVIGEIFPDAPITSGRRTAEHNKAVGGAERSWHVQGQALDFVPPKGSTVAQVRAELERRGLPVTELLDEGDHFHWAWGGGTRQAPAGEPTVRSDRTTAQDDDDAGFSVDFSGSEAPKPRAQEDDAKPAEPDLTDRAFDALRSGETVRPERGPSLIEYLARNGGLADLGGELRSIDAERWHRNRPFTSRLVREDGLNIGDAAVRAQERGYLPERFGEGDTRAAPQDLIDAIREELAGKPRFGREDPDGEDLKAHVQDLDEVLNYLGLDPAKTSNADLRRAVDRYFAEPEPVGKFAMGGGRKRQVFDPEAVDRLDPEKFGQPKGTLRTIDELLTASELPRGNTPARVRLAPVTVWARDQARKAGISLNGFVHELNVDQVNHILKHSDPEAERAQGNIPVGKEDLARIPEIVTEPDFMVVGLKSDGGVPRIGFVKHLADGSTVYIEEVWTGRKGLAAVTMWKRPAAMSKADIEAAVNVQRHPGAQVIPRNGGAPAALDAPAKQAPELYGRTNGGLDATIGKKPPGDKSALKVARSSGLREAPRPGAVAEGATPKFSGESISKLADRLRKALGVTHRQGRVTSRGALGEYDPKTAVIRTKQVQELDVLAHEGFHALDMWLKFPAVKAAMQRFKGELELLDYDPVAGRLHEGFAEFGRWYITNPDYAQKVAPGFYDAFEDALFKSRPDLLRDLKDVQAAYKQLLMSASLDVAAASVAHTGRGGPMTRAAQVLKEKGVGGVVTDLADQAYTAFIDDLHPIAKAVRELQEIYAENTGRRLDLKTARNPYALARLSREAYAAGHNDLMEGVVPYHSVDPEGPSLAEALEHALGAKALGKWKQDDLDRFDGYLIARRMVHEWDRFESGELDRAPDKNSKEFHAQVIKDAEAKNKTWHEAAQLIYDWQGALWRKERDAGLITPETYQNGADKPDYVPLMRDVSDKGNGAGKKPRGGLQYAGGSKRFKGSTRDVISPLTSMMRRAYELNAIIKRNEVLKTLDDLAKLAGPGGGAIVERLPRHESEVIQVNAREALENAAKAQGMSVRDVTTMLTHVDSVLDPEAQAKIFRQRQMDPKKGENVVFVWRDGEKTPLLLADGKFGEEMFTAIAGMNKEMSSALLDAFSAGTQLLRHGVTLSPEFMARNIIRDQVATWINTDVGYVPGYHFVKGAVEQARQGPMAKRYAAAGGMRGGLNTSAVKKPFPKTDPEAEKQLAHLRKKGYRIRVYKPWTLQGLAALTDLSETGTRLGVMGLAFKKAKARGLNDYEAVTEAAYTSRDYLDFGRRGAKMLSAVRTVTFLNAALQGLDKAARVLSAGGNLRRVLAPLGKAAPRTDSEKRALAHAYRAWAKISALAVMGGALRALYADDPDYEEIGDRGRATHWWFKANGHWWAIPKPFELAEPSNIVERAFEAAVLKDPKTGERFVSDFMNVIAPPHDIPALSVPWQIGTNRDYQGRPIVPDHLRGTVDPQMQFNAYTSQVGKAIGRALGVAPAVVDHVITGFGGSLGRYALQGSNLAIERATGKPRTESGPEDLFLSRAFVRDVSRGSTSQKEFWDKVSRSGGEFTRAEGTFRAHLKAGDDAKATAYLNKLEPSERAYVQAKVFTHEGSSKNHPMVRAQEALSAISDLRRKVRDDELKTPHGKPIELTPSQRRGADDALGRLAMVEMRTALTMAGEKGWAQRQPMSRETALQAVEAARPGLRRALMVEMQDQNVRPFSRASEWWNQNRSRLETAPDPDRLARMMSKKRLDSSDRGQVREERHRIRERRLETAA